MSSANVHGGTEGADVRSASASSSKTELQNKLDQLKREINRKIDNNPLSLDTDITKFLLENTRPGKEKQLELFQNEFRKIYGLSDADYAKMSALLSEKYKEKPDFLFDERDALKAGNAESLVLLELKIKEKKDVKFEPFVDRIPDRYKGIKTLGDLIAKYNAAASSEDTNRLKSELAENEMHKMLEILGKYKIDDLPSELRVRFAEIKRDFYKAYLRSNPKNKLLVEVVHYNLGQVLMVYFQQDQEALSHFKKAVEMADEDYKANPDPAGDAAARHDFYKMGLEACEENIKNSKK
ncbi:MAG: hypothetical protein QW666_00195 [Candidatus Woesearchaeota archaeon]